MSELPLSDGQFVLPGNRWDLLAGRLPPRLPSVSVVVPYFEGQDDLDRVLTALSVQTYPQQLLEVIVADDGSTEAPSLTAAAGLHSRLVRQDDRGFRAAAARNLGAAAAGGDVLCFLDGDTVPEPAYISELSRLPALTADALTVGRRRHAELDGWTPGQVAAWLTGQGAAPHELPEPAWLVEAYRRTNNLLDLDDVPHRYVISAVMSCSRSLFVELAGFDGSLVGYGGEDWELAHRALCAGAVLAHAPEAVAWHNGADWAARADPERRRQQKNVETAQLAQRIPARQAGVWSGRPDVIVTLDVGDEEEAAVIVSVFSILGSGRNVSVSLLGMTDSLCRELFGADPRVTVGPPSDAAVASARYLVEQSRPVILTAAGWDHLSAELGPGRGGQLRLTSPDGEVIASSTGILRRAARWQSSFTELPPAGLVAALAPSRISDGAAYGLRPLPRHPDLAHELAHLSDP